MARFEVVIDDANGEFEAAVFEQYTTSKSSDALAVGHGETPLDALLSLVGDALSRPDTTLRSREG